MIKTSAKAQLSVKPPLRKLIVWPIETEQLAKTSSRLQTRMTSPPPAESGAFSEFNEDNNSLGIPIASSLSAYGTLHPSVLNGVIASIQDFVPQEVLDFLWRVLSGQTENWIQLVLNIGISIIPVLGAIPDIISLIVDPSPFVKAVSVLGIAFSLGDLVILLAWLGVTVPVAAGSFVGDAASAALKALFKTSDEIVQGAFKGLKFIEAFQVVKVLTAKVIDEVFFIFGRFGDDLPSARALFDEVLIGGTNLWGDFTAYVRKVRTAAVLKQGITDGSFFIGKLERLGFDLGEVGEETFKAIGRIGDELAAAGLRLSDEAAQGLGRVTDELGGESAERFVRKLLGNPNVSDDLVNETLEVIGRAGGNANWSDEALDGVENILIHAKGAGPGKIENLLRVVDDPEIANKTFMVARSITKAWDDEALEGIATLLRHIDGDTKKVVRLIEGLGATGESNLGERLFRLINQGEKSALGNTDNWSGFLRSLAGVGDEGAGVGNLWGRSHVLFYIEESGGFSKFAGVEEFLTDGTVRRFYDLRDSDGALYELKNVANVGTRDFNQFIVDLQLLDDTELRRLKWVFRGSEGDLPFTRASFLKGVRDRIISRADLLDEQERLLVRLDDIFDDSNIVFTGGSRPYP